MHARVPSPTEKSRGRAETPSPPGCQWPCSRPTSQENGRGMSAERLKPGHKKGLAGSPGRRAELGWSLGLQAHGRAPSLGPDEGREQRGREPPCRQDRASQTGKRPRPSWEPGQDRPALKACLRPEETHLTQVLAGALLVLTWRWPASPWTAVTRCSWAGCGPPGPDSGSGLGPAGEGPGWGTGRRTGFRAVPPLASSFPHPLGGLRVDVGMRMWESTLGAWDRP